MPPTTIAEYQALTGADALTKAEHQLIGASRAGLPCRLGEGEDKGELPAEGDLSSERRVAPTSCAC